MSSQHQHRNQFQAVSDCFHIYFGIIHYSSYCQPRVMKQNGPRSYTGLPSLLCFADWADVASIRSPNQRWKRRISLLAAFAARPVHKQRRIALRLTIVVVAEFNLKKKVVVAELNLFFSLKYRTTEVVCLLIIYIWPPLYAIFLFAHVFLSSTTNFGSTWIVLCS